MSDQEAIAKGLLSATTAKYDKTIDELINQCEDECVIQHIRQHIVNPEFEKAGKVHDWRNYVPDLLMQDWEKLLYETRALVVIMAAYQADAENWD